MHTKFNLVILISLLIPNQFIKQLLCSDTVIQGLNSCNTHYTYFTNMGTTDVK